MAKKSNLDTLNSKEVLRLLIETTNPVLVGRLRYLIKIIANNQRDIVDPKLFKYLTKYRIGKKHVVINTALSLSQVKDMFENELRVNGVTVPIEWFYTYN